MEKSTEKILVYASVLVIVVSLASIGMEFTGYVTTDAATVNITLATTEAINFTVDNIDFGSRSFNTSATYGQIQTNGTGLNYMFNGTVVTTNLTLVNIGNVNVSLNITSNVDAATLFGGAVATPLFQFLFTNDEVGSCNSTQANISFQTLSSTQFKACDNFQWADTSDQLAIDLNLLIPVDGTKGARGAVITATATAL